MQWTMLMDEAYPKVGDNHSVVQMWMYALCEVEPAAIVTDTLIAHIGFHKLQPPRPHECVVVSCAWGWHGAVILLPTTSPAVCTAADAAM